MDARQRQSLSDCTGTLVTRNLVATRLSGASFARIDRVIEIVDLIDCDVLGPCPWCFRPIAMERRIDVESQIIIDYLVHTGGACANYIQHSSIHVYERICTANIPSA